MTARILDGRRVAAEVRREVAAEVAALVTAGIRPGLAVVLLGEDPASALYVGNKEQACREVGIFTETLRPPATIAQGELLDIVAALSADERFHGVLVQLPLPPHIDEQAIIEAILPAKDVDGTHPFNMGRLAEGRPTVVPPTPAGILELLRREGIPTEGRRAVVVGRSTIVGKPLALALMLRGPGGDATVTVCHSRTPDLAQVTAQADILIAAAGQAGLIRRQMVKLGAAIIDVGINRVPAPGSRTGRRIVGDVEYEEVVEVAGAITPVPGGVGPMTVAMLLKNTVQAARRAQRPRPQDR